jgi:hypothetical protein
MREDGDMRIVCLVLVGGCMSLAQPKAPDRPWHSKSEDCSPSYGYSAAAAAIAAAALGVGWILWSTDAPKPDEGIDFHFGRALAIPLFGIAGIEGLDSIYAASKTGDCREYQRFADSPDVATRSPR